MVLQLVVGLYQTHFFTSQIFIIKVQILALKTIHRIFMLSLILAGLIFILPPSLEAHQDEIIEVVAQKQEEFLDQCYKWQDPVKCDKVLAKAKMTIVDDFIFPVRLAPHGTAHGKFNGVKRIKESLYNRIST